VAAFLQLLKEAGMRAGEAWQLEWIDADFVKRTIRITLEKGSNPRIFKFSGKLIEMLLQLKAGGRNRSGGISGYGSLHSLRRTFER